MTAVAARLAAEVARATNEAFVLEASRPVSGGCIHTALSLEGRGSSSARRFFAKVNEPGAAAMFAAEADGLAALRDARALRVPNVVVQGSDDEAAWIVLEWLDLQPLVAASAAQLGEALARQHRIPQQRFGWPKDNFIGATPQQNAPSGDWHEFWRDRRLVAQLKLAARNRLPSRMIDRGERLAADCEAFFRGLAVQPSLLHGDLWSLSLIHI